ncbi:YciI family protein [Desulfuromonas thiophila]|uniref:YciI family protein n=1 Tax=Desulfuromonas thiophila TaxID=57664 RepID=UPI0024A92A94|nr:YciI family protein [Desulfuromonas thiophila]
MLYVIHAQDKPGQLAVRQQNRPTHVAYLKNLGERLFAAGPTLDEQGDMNGSVVILDCADLAAAQEFARNDPYAQAGLFAQVSIQPWKKVLPEA